MSLFERVMTDIYDKSVATVSDKYSMLLIDSGSRLYTKVIKTGKISNINGKNVYNLPCK